MNLHHPLKNNKFKMKIKVKVKIKKKVRIYYLIYIKCLKGFLNLINLLLEMLVKL